MDSLAAARRSGQDPGSSGNTRGALTALGQGQPTEQGVAEVAWIDHGVVGEPGGRMDRRLSLLGSQSCALSRVVDGAGLREAREALRG